MKTNLVLESKFKLSYNLKKQTKNTKLNYLTT